MTKRERDALRKAMGDYIASEGCSCCRSSDRHAEALNRIGRLLGVRKTKDWHGPGENGYNFYQFAEDS